MILPPSNVQVVPGSEDGKLEGTHYYIVMGLDGNQAKHRSPYAYSANITMDKPGSAIITWTPVALESCWLLRGKRAYLQQLLCSGWCFEQFHRPG